MGTASAIHTLKNGRTQFQGVFDTIAIVEFDLAEVIVSGNSNDETTISVPYIDHETDFVIGWTHSHAGAHAHEMIEEFHTWDGALHLVLHNRSGSPVTNPATVYKVVVGRMVN